MQPPASPAKSSEKAVITSSHSKRAIQEVNYKETGGTSKTTGKRKRIISGKAQEER